MKKLWKKFKYWKDRPVRKMVQDFSEAFPGRCMICSYHAFGVREGLTKELYPPPHECIEKDNPKYKKEV